VTEQSNTTPSFPPDGGFPDLRWFRANNEPFLQIIEPHFVYRDGTRRMESATIDDPLYGTFDFDCSSPGDAALMSLFYSDAFNRLGLIEQLVLPERFATKPEAANYSVFEHSLGCVLLSRRLGASPEQQLRTAIHDLASRAMKHLEDWRQEGIGGPEKYSERLLDGHLKYWGLDHMLESHGFSAQELAAEQPPDFIENKAPKLCVDRVDYALREFARWTCPAEVPQLIEELEVRGDEIAFKTQESARIFAVNYHRLYYEHWAEEEHATREKLLLTAIEYGIEKGAIREEDMETADPYVMVKLEMYGDDVVQNLLWLLGRPNLEITIHHGPEDVLSEEYMKSLAGKLVIPIKAFRKRSVDPCFISDDGSTRRLSEADEEFRDYLRGLTSTETEGEEETADDQPKLVKYAVIEVEEEVKQMLSTTGKLL